jgi:hypothetical protein
MYPEVRIHIIETSKEIIRERGEKITAENIKIEFDKLVDGLQIPRKVTTKIIRGMP